MPKTVQQTLPLEQTNQQVFNEIVSLCEKYNKTVFEIAHNNGAMPKVVMFGEPESEETTQLKARNHELHALLKTLQETVWALAHKLEGARVKITGNVAHDYQEHTGGIPGHIGSGRWITETRYLNIEKSTQEITKVHSYVDTSFMHHMSVSFHFVYHRTSEYYFKIPFRDYPAEAKIDSVEFID